MKLELQNEVDWKRWPYLVAAVALVLISYMVFPLLDGMILGIVFAYVGRPIRDLFGPRRILGSLVATCCIIIPISLILALGVLEVVNQLMWLTSHKDELLWISSSLITSSAIPPVIFEGLSGSIKSILDIAASIAASLPVLGLGRSFSMGFINFLLSFLVCYFLLADGDRLKGLLMEILPKGLDDINSKYFARADKILSGIFLGSIYTSIAGGAASVVIFYLFDVPRPFAMASVVFLAGLVPFLTWLVFIPTAIYRYFTLGPADALAFFLVGSILVHIAELVIRPYFVSTRSSLHPLLVMITFLGGGLVAGLGGFFLAPALTGLVYAIYQVERERYTERSNPDQSQGVNKARSTTKDRQGKSIDKKDLVQAPR